MTGLNRKTRAFLGLGGNLGQPEPTMAAALRALDANPGVEVERVSSIYRTPPWGQTNQPDFLNAVAEVWTDLDPHALLSLCLEIERVLKRERRERWGPRLVDIDILIFGDAVISDNTLQVPHPQMLMRAFVLVPLAEIAPDLVLDGQPIKKHLARLDTPKIERLKPESWWWEDPIRR